MTVVLAAELARRGGAVVIIDADPNRPVTAWASRRGWKCGPLPARVDTLARDQMPLDQSAVAPAGKREQRRYRTGRNQQLNLKVRAQDVDAFYAIPDVQGWVLGDVFARAVAALTRELQQESSRYPKDI